MDNKTREDFFNRIHQVIDTTEDAIRCINSYVCEVPGDLHFIEELVYMLEKEK